MWEAIVMLVLLKIPLVYLCLVVWWAIRAEPRDEQPAIVASVSDTPTPPPAAGLRSPRRDGHHPGGRRGSRRGAPRARRARSEART